MRSVWDSRLGVIGAAIHQTEVYGRPVWRLSELRLILVALFRPCFWFGGDLGSEDEVG